MCGYGAFAFACAALICWMGFNGFKYYGNHRRLAANRHGMTQETFLEVLGERGVAQDVALEIYQWITAYYGRETLPHADDLMKDDVAIYPEDIEFFVADFFKKSGMPTPTCRNPEVLPDYRESTLSSLALYLTHRRTELLQKDVLPA